MFPFKFGVIQRIKLQTGYDLLGPYDYAHFVASSVPELSLAGNKPFTFFTAVCFKSVQGGAIFTQENGFYFGIMDGQPYVTAVNWCTVKFSDLTVGKFITNHWDEQDDSSMLTVYVSGEKKYLSAHPEKEEVSTTQLLIGKKLDAYFKTFCLIGR